MRTALLVLLLVAATPAAAQDFSLRPDGLGGPKKLGTFDPSAAPVKDGPPVVGRPADKVQAFEPTSTGSSGGPPRALNTGPATEKRIASYDPTADAKPETISEAAPDVLKAKARVTEYLDAQGDDKPKPIRWRFLLLGVLGTLLAIPMMRVAWRRFTHEHELEGASGPVPADIAANRRDLGTAERLITPSERAINVARRAGTWVTVDRIATQLGVEQDEALELLEALEQEARLESRVDEQGRTVFRFVARS